MWRTHWQDHLSSLYWNSDCSIVTLIAHSILGYVFSSQTRALQEMLIVVCDFKSFVELDTSSFALTCWVSQLWCAVSMWQQHHQHRPSESVSEAELPQINHSNYKVHHNKYSSSTAIRWLHVTSTCHCLLAGSSTSYPHTTNLSSNAIARLTML